jgi:predicted porin
MREAPFAAPARCFRRPAAGRRGQTATAILLVLGTLAFAASPGMAQTPEERIQALEQQMLEMQRAFQDQMQALQREVEALREGAPTPIPPAPTPPVAAQEYGVEEEPEETTRATQEATEPVVSSSQPRIKLSVSGQVNRAVNVANDGDQTKAYYVDNNVSNSRLRLLGVGQLTEDLRFGAQLETAFSPNNSADVSQINETADDFIDVRRAEVAIDSVRFGRLWLGKGSSATDAVAEYDLSGIDVIMYSAVEDIAGGLLFRDDDGDLTDVSIGDAFSDFDGGRQDRVRYDKVFGGLQFSASTGSDQRYDAALSFGNKFGSWQGVKVGPFTTLGGIGIADPSADDVDFRVLGSTSVLHDRTGLNLTLSGGMDEADGRDPYNLYAKAGWYGTLNTLGNTGFGIDFTRSNEIETAGDTGYSVGGAVVQTVEGYGTELYSQVRWYSLDRDDAPSVDDIVVGTLGTRVKF